MRFEILGPIAVVTGTRRLEPRSHRQRVCLAMLLLGANRTVSTESIIDAIWEDRPPPTAIKQVYICVSVLRRMLRELGAPDDVITTVPPGYLLRAEPGQLDALGFEQRSAEAMTLAQDGRLDEAVASMRRALALWHGPALAGLSTHAVRSRAVRLEENRLLAVENCTDWELELGWHAALVGELAERAGEHPLRERTRGQLMRALHASGRQAEALEVYHDARDELLDKLGLEPGEELRRIQSAILADDPSGSQPPVVQPAQVVATPLPHELPADVPDFTGRHELVEDLAAELRPTESSVPVAVVAGMVGVGKSALAVHVAHRIAPTLYPDGELYADLRGSRTDPQHPADVLDHFLRSLGVPWSTVPPGAGERASMYRSLLADRQVMVMLEDARSEDHVRPLIPGTPSSAVLVTSRSRLTGIPGTRLVEVDRFDEAEAVDLLSKIMGPRRIAAEMEAARALTALVGRLPLAVRIIGARLAAHPHWTLASMVDQLADETRLLDELTHGDLTARSVIEQSYASRQAPARRLLRLLSLLDVQDFSSWVVHALLDVGRAQAMAALQQLVNGGLVDVLPAATAGATRYVVPDLVTLYAREHADEDPPQLRHDALSRVRGGFLALAEASVRPAREGHHPERLSVVDTSQVASRAA